MTSRDVAGYRRGVKAANPSYVRTPRLTRLEYEGLVDRGVLDEDDRIELLDGRLVFREPQGSRHAAACLRIRIALDRTFGRGPVREVMVDIFSIIGPRSPEADDYRNRLQSMLY